MAYGDYDGPDKATKGHEGGACNRQRCQAEPASFYNHGSMSWYCADCARDIGEDVVNKRDWELRWKPDLGHAMFETRGEMSAREERTAKTKESAELSHRYTSEETLREAVGPYFGWPRGREKPQSSSLKRLLGSARIQGGRR
jgi:hypothetical protein